MDKRSKDFYKKMIGDCHKNFIRVLLTDEEMRKTRELACSIVEAKKTEQHHIIDGDKEIKRFWTGLKADILSHFSNEKWRFLIGFASPAELDIAHKLRT